MMAGSRPPAWMSGSGAPPPGRPLPRSRSIDARGSTMTGTTARFFEELEGRGHEPLLGRITGTIRFDLDHDNAVDRWFVAIDKGDVKVSHKNAKADTVVRVDRDLFDGMAGGRVN